MDCLCGCLFSPMRWEADNKEKYLYSKYLYFAGFLITSVLTWVLRDHASLWFARHAGAVQFCSEGQGQVDEDRAASCAGGQIAMRISFANFVFFALHAVVLFWAPKTDGDPRVHLHTGFWSAKLLLWVGALVGFFFVPTSAIYGYAQFARIASGFYLVLQIAILINFIYVVNELLIEKDNKPAWAVLISGTIITFGLGLVLIGFSYHLYAPDPSCHRNLFFSTWSLVVGIALVAILFIPKRAPTAGLLTSGILFLYASYLLISSLNSDPGSEECIRGEGTSPQWIQIVGFFISLAAVMYSVQSAGTSGGDIFVHGGKSSENLETDLPYRADFFHVVFALASMYIAMLFSFWEVSPSTSEFEIDRGTISAWVKIASKWVCEALYIWTVVAPSIFRNRDFDYS
ncbi:serine incorporator/TMS membrane protein [Dunaliella salina]|uniref:Serine incorporator/TMS membrane protein n=1 Tax=Dunaliella salina TaxID=3046 RepID=A0ABQ7H1C7_DUNSA|nr:serine incorporator/TMS membrane protein [Dunaliella salina]|eukprot:KAF5840654.1 serine incorporator/TMS membrane protein [Dunaliella salina]